MLQCLHTDQVSMFGKRAAEAKKVRQQHEWKDEELSNTVSCCMTINSKWQVAAGEISQKNLCDVNEVELHSAILSVDPVLWNVVVLQTLSTGERKALLSGEDDWCYD